MVPPARRAREIANRNGPRTGTYNIEEHRVHNGNETKPTPTGTSKPKKRTTLTQRDARLGLWLMSPTLVVVLLIVIFPLLWSILLPSNGCV